MGRGMSLLNHKKWIYVWKYGAYAAVMLLLYILQTTPGLFAIYGIKPNLVIPAAVAIAFLEDEYLGGIYGAFAGILCDFGGFSLYGMGAMVIMVSCVVIGLLAIYMLRPTMINFIIALLLLMLLRGLMDFLFSYAMWNYENVMIVLVYKILPTIVYSVAVGPLMLVIYRRLQKYFAGKLEV